MGPELTPSSLRVYRSYQRRFFAAAARRVEQITPFTTSSAANVVSSEIRRELSTHQRVQAEQSEVDFLAVIWIEYPRLEDRDTGKS